MPVTAAIDVGSNAIRLAIAFVDDQKKLTIQENVREPIRLGREVFAGGIISEETIALSKEAFRKFRGICQDHKVELIRAVATSALREAQNKEDFIEKIAAASDIRITLIDGSEEARLVTLAVQKEMDLKKKLALGVDIGGGSVEVTLISDEDIIISDSLQIGAVRLLQLLEEKKRGRKIFNRLVRGYVEGIKSQLKRELGKRKVELCIGTGGNIEALGALRVSLLGKTDKSFLKSEELDEIVEQIQALSYEERIEKLKLRPDRADVIVPASIIIQEIMRQADVKQLQIPCVGLKEGVLLDMLPELSGIKPEIQKKQVLAFSFELGQRYSFDEAHGVRVAKFAMDLFDGLAAQHKLGSEERLLLEVAALLHDIGQCVNISGHHKHSFYLLKSTPFVGLTRRQQDIVACLARYHRKTSPKNDHDTYGTLPAEDKEMVRKLSAILRLAEAMDREHLGNLKSFSIDLKKGEMSVKLKGEGDLLLERWALENKCGLFNEVFDLKLSIEE